MIYVFKVLITNYEAVKISNVKLTCIFYEIFPFSHIFSLSLSLSSPVRILTHCFFAFGVLNSSELNVKSFSSGSFTFLQFKVKRGPLSSNRLWPWLKSHYNHNLTFVVANEPNETPTQKLLLHIKMWAVGPS